LTSEQDVIEQDVIEWAARGSFDVKTCRP